MKKYDDDILDADMRASIKEIGVEEWFPSHASLEYPDELWRWITSINENFKTRIHYEPYEIWKKQAFEWLKDESTITDFDTPEEQADFLHREFERCRDNTLYFANRHGWIMEGDQKSGWTKYDAYEAQMIVMFLFDCGYSLIIGKPRQVGFTSTIILCAIKRINFNRNYFIKFITKDLDKAEEIIDKKLKPSFSKVPDWLAQEALLDSAMELKLATKIGKGKLGGFNSSILVGKSSEDSINGGSPNLVLVDEIGLFPGFPLMLAEARPALFWTNPATGKYEMKRQVIAWGTGYNMNQGGAHFEAEFNTALEAWKEKRYRYGMIPLFFNAYARVGITEDEIKKERKEAYAKMGPDREEFRVKFHQAYPITMADMFMRSSRTMLPIEDINAKLLEIGKLDDDLKPKYGYFEPIFDLNTKVENLYWPYKVIGSRFIETGAMDDDQTTTCMFAPPEPWKNRYYKGTDPISSQTGKSKFSSSIWDKMDMTLSAVLFYRTDNPEDAYSQSLLMSLHYCPHGQWWELIESNLGDDYQKFLETYGYGRNVIPNMRLQDSMRGASGKWWGVSNKTNTAEAIFTAIKTFVRKYYKRIYIPWWFLQLKTFVEKDLKNPTNSSRTSRYQANDLKNDRDDALFSSGYAKIAADAYPDEQPEEIRPGSQEDKFHTRWIQDERTNYVRKKALVDEQGRVIRFMEHGHRRIKRGGR